MCGIVGIINLKNKPVSHKEIKKFRDSLFHRGEDDEGIFIKNNLGLGHRRLSIIDLSDKAKQPMIYNNRYVITYNGECYNYESIKSELKQKGYRFNTNSDTEVILAGYQHWGKNIQNKLNGMWAFAIYDLKENEIFISRDRFGIKPLYYLVNENLIAFSSEMKSFMFLEKENIPEFNDENLINLETDETSGRTFLKKVSVLEPGYSIKIKNNKIEKLKWWNLCDNLIEINYKNVYEDFYNTLLDSLKKCLVGDVKMSFSLSGGLDSTSLYFLSNHVKNNEYLREKSLSPDFTNYFSLRYKNSAKFDDTVVDQLQNNSDKIEIFNVQDDEFKYENIIKNIYYFEGIGEDATGPFELYKKIKKRGFKVSIDGHGPDEMLGGYPTHILFALADSFFDKKRFSNINILGKMISSHKSQDLSMSRKNLLFFFTKQILKKIIQYKDHFFLYQTNGELFNLPSQFKAPIKKKELNFYSFLNNKLFNDFNYGSLQENLRKFDRISMSNGIESRVPYLDHRLVSFCFSLNSKFKINKNNKEILRETINSKMKLPSIVYDRNIKEGFGSTPNSYISSMSNFINDTISNKDFSYYVSFCNTSELKKFINDRNYSKLKKAFRFCQVYYLKKTFLDKINITKN